MTEDGPLRTTPGWDVVAAVVYLGLTQAEVWIFLEGEITPDTQVAGSVLVTLMAVALAFRSSRPVPAFFVHGILIGAATVLGIPGDVYPFGNLFLLATVASVATPPIAWVSLATGLVGVGSYFWRFGQPVIFAAFTMSLWALAWAGGRAARSRRRELVLAHERNLSVASAEARDARLALEVQRRDISREIHDLVGHTINVMVVHAGAGRRGLDRDPDEARRALVTIEQVGRGALEALDGLLASLSTTTNGRRPLQGIADLGRLVDGVGTTGIEVSLDDGLERPVPRVVGATVYRVVQEALTNTLKHAGAQHVEVELVERAGEVVVTVRDDGNGSTGGVGRGLDGMEERVAAHGGVVDHGDRPDGGYRVTATIPVRR